MRSISFYLCTLTLCTPLCSAQSWIRHTIDDSSRGADGVRLADANGDGRLDIVTGWEEGGQVRVYLQPDASKTKLKWPAVTVGRVKSPEDAVFVDLDHNGVTDVVSSCEGSNKTMYIHWAPADADAYLDADSWTTAAIPCTRGKQMWMFALPMQVDGRHGTDIVVGSKGTGASLGWLQAPRDARQVNAWSFHHIANAGWIMSLKSFDVDGDGDLDILTTDRKGPAHGLRWLERIDAPPHATKQFAAHQISTQSGEYMFLAVGALQLESTDVLCAQKSQQIFRFTQSQDKGSWAFDSIPMPPGCGSGKGVAIGDIDLDGQNDVVFSCEHAIGDKSGLRWMSSNASDFARGWRDYEISGRAGVKFDRIELLDLDADDDLDVITCEERDNLGVIWYENPTQ